MNRNNDTDISPEVMLRKKMDELSSSVDCLDKITSQVFPQSKLDFSESGFVVSGLENVTEKHKHLNALKWIAFASAAAVAIAYVPKTDGFRSFLSHISYSSSSKQLYNMTASEIYSLADGPDYLVYDVPLSYYAQNDILVTPLMSCPFSCTDSSDNVRVRIFVRTISGFLTNEVSAVEYEDSYSESNFIATAVSAYRFTDEDIKNAKTMTFYSLEDEVIEAAENSFFDIAGNLSDPSGKAVSLASFSQNCFIKDGSGVSACTVDVLYGHNYIKYDGDGYFYDMLFSKDGNISSLPERDIWWADSLLSNGSNAMPENSESIFTRTAIFNTGIKNYSNSVGLGFIIPYGSTEEAYSNDSFPQFDPEEVLKCELWLITNQGVLSEVIPPVDRNSARNMKIFLTPYHFSDILTGYSENNGEYGNYSVKVTSGKSGLNESFPLESISFTDSFYENAALQIQCEINALSENETSYADQYSADGDALSNAKERLDFLRQLQQNEHIRRETEQNIQAHIEAEKNDQARIEAEKSIQAQIEAQQAQAENIH